MTRPKGSKGTSPKRPGRKVVGVPMTPDLIEAVEQYRKEQQSRLDGDIEVQFVEAVRSLVRIGLREASK
jgi:hypothetical protein